MTLNGAIKQLHELRSAEDMPFYYKPAIAEVINVLLMDTQEVSHGHWIDTTDEPYGEVYRPFICSLCRGSSTSMSEYCPNCGAKMDEVEE